jgi:hypothetical protein
MVGGIKLGQMKDNTLFGGVVIYALASYAASATITIADDMNQLRRVQSTGGAITLSTTPFGTSPANFADGQIISLEGESSTNTVEVTHNDIQYGCLINGNFTLEKGSVISLRYNENLERFIEIYRNNL